MFVTTMRIQLSLAFMSAHPPILLDTVSMVDSIILMVMALVVFGPRRLPQIGRQIGKLMYEFRKASNDFKFQMEEELRASEEAERRKKEEERQRSLAALAASDQASVSADPPVKLPDPPYPSVTTEPVSAEAQPYPPDAPDTVASNETAPRILPPSTGETVAAARPNRASEPPSDTPPSYPAIEHPSITGSPDKSKTLSDHAADSAEALNQHG